MSVISKEKSVQESKPYELLRFVYGPRDSDIATYTTRLEPVTFNAESYMPLPFDREAIVVGQSLDRAVLAIRLPRDSVIAQQYRLYPPVVPITVTIFRGQEGEEEPIPIWVGRVVWGNFEADQSIRLECEPITTGFKRVGLHLHYQHICPHVLYDSKTCKATRGDHLRTEIVSSVNGTEVTFAAQTVNDPFRFAGGSLEFDINGARHRRTIYRKQDFTAGSVPSTRLILIGTVEGLLQTGDEITIVRGCSRTITECKEVFNNAVNFGGFPFIPKKNPTNSNRTFY